MVKQPGAVAKQPGALTAQPGAVPKHPGAVPKQAGTVAKQPGAVAKQPGTLAERPGAVAKTVAQSPHEPPPPEVPLAEDPLYVLVGGLTEDPVCSDGEIREARLTEVLKRLWDGAARKPKDWVAAWQAMVIPMDRQCDALHKFLNMTFMQTEDPDRAPMVVAELVKSHKVKMRSMEEVLTAFGHNLDGITAMNEDAWHIYAKFLVNLFPKPAGSGWGWSRVGWNWISWWQFVEKCTQTLESAQAFDVIALILRLIQDREGEPLAQLHPWTDGDKLQRVISKLAELVKCDNREVVQRLCAQGITAKT